MNFIMPTFWNTLSVPSSQAGTYLPMKMEQSFSKRRHISFRRRGITQKKSYINYPFFHCALKTSNLTYLLQGAESFLTIQSIFSQSRNSQHFMEPECSLPQSQVPATCPYPEQISPVPTLTSYFLKIHLNIILSSTPGSSKWSPSLIFPHQNPVCTSALPHTCYIPRIPHSRFDHPKNIG